MNTYLAIIIIIIELELTHTQIIFWTMALINNKKV